MIKKKLLYIFLFFGQFTLFQTYAVENSSNYLKKDVNLEQKQKSYDENVDPIFGAGKDKTTIDSVTETRNALRDFLPDEEITYEDAKIFNQKFVDKNGKIQRNKFLNTDIETEVKNIIKDRQEKEEKDRKNSVFFRTFERFNNFIDKTNHYDEVNTKVGLFEFKPGLNIGVGLGTHTTFQVGAEFTTVYNFNSNFAIFGGVDVKYLYQQKVNTELLKTTTIEGNFFSRMDFQQKMNFDFRFGTRFKINNNFFISPYAILGGSYGTVSYTQNTYTMVGEQNREDIYRQNITKYETYNTTNREYKDLTEEEKKFILDKTKNWDKITESRYENSLDVLKNIIPNEEIFNKFIQNLSDSDLKKLRSQFHYEINNGDSQTIYTNLDRNTIINIINGYNSIANANINSYQDAYNVGGRINDNRQREPEQTEPVHDTSKDMTINGDVKKESTGIMSDIKTLGEESKKTTVEQKNKLFLKGGIGIEFDFKNRFFIRLEYKYMRPKIETTNTYITNVNVYKVDRTDIYVGVNRTDNIKTITYNTIYKDSSYSLNIDGLNVNAPSVDLSYNEGQITNDTSVVNDPNYKFSHSIYSNKQLIDTYQKPDQKTKITSINIHEFSIGFGFYFL